MYTEQLTLLLAVFERAALMLIILFLLTRSYLFQQTEVKRDRKLIAMLAIMFTVFAVFSARFDAGSDDYLVNIQLIAILSGGILFGPWIALPAGLCSALYTYLSHSEAVTPAALAISSVVAALLAWAIHAKCHKEHYSLLGIAAGLVCQLLTLSILITLQPHTAFIWSQVKFIAPPMLISTICIGTIIMLIQDLDNKKDKISASQTRKTLNIANKALLLFRKHDHQSLTEVCQIIQDETNADAVAITDTHDVIAYVGIGEENFHDEHHQISSVTQQAVYLGKQIISNDVNVHDFHSLLIIPLWENGQVTGTLKIFYRQPHRVRQALREMAIGLSHLISTQLELSKKERLKTLTNRAEFSALRSKINPNFLSDTLNIISATSQVNPLKAHQLITDLSEFLRFNLRNSTDFIDIQDEIALIRHYVALEQARLGESLEVMYDIDSVHIDVPSLLIQPLVENAIQQGISPTHQNGKVVIAVKKDNGRIKISVRDTGIALDPESIEQIVQGKAGDKYNGISNVNQRIKLVYNTSLQIERRSVGTQVSFYIHPLQNSLYSS